MIVVNLKSPDAIVYLMYLFVNKNYYFLNEQSQRRGPLYVWNVLFVEWMTSSRFEKTYST